MFEPEIFNAIKKTNKGVRGEIQLTDSIQTLIDKHFQVLATIMKDTEPCIDIGTPANYFSALSYSYRLK